MNAAVMTRNRVSLPLPPKPEPNLRDYQVEALREREELARTYAYLAHTHRAEGRVAAAEFYERQLAAVTARRDRTRNQLEGTR